ncbi:MAG: DUF4924 family protein [Salibacteraceae bacterium]
MQLSGQQKDKNVVEYLIYMWHIEDVIRTYEFDIDLIQEYIITPTEIPAINKLETREWYVELIKRMKEQKLDRKGHLKELQVIVQDLTTLHNSLVNVVQDREYLNLYSNAQPNVSELRKRSSGLVRNEIELCLNGIYGVLMLRLKQKEISDGTKEAVETFSNMLNYLAVKYRENKGNIQFPPFMKN